MTRYRMTLAALLVLGLARPGLAAPPAKPIEIRAVICTTWEYEPNGKDMFGELKAWKERWPLTETLPFPGGTHALHYDPKTHVLAVVTGMGSSRGAASVTALGHDPRFDLSRHDGGRTAELDVRREPDSSRPTISAMMIYIIDLVDRP